MLQGEEIGDSTGAHTSLPYLPNCSLYHLASSMWGATRPLWPWWPCSWKASRGRPRSLPPRRGEVYGIRVSLWHQRLCTQAKCRKATLKERCMIWKGRVCPVKILECNITQRPIHIWLQVTIYWYIHTVYTCDNIVSYYLFVYMIFMCSNKLDYSIAFGKPAGHRGVAPRVWCAF